MAARPLPLRSSLHTLPAALVATALLAAAALVTVLGCSGSVQRSADVSSDRAPLAALSAPVRPDVDAATPATGDVSSSAGFYPLDLGNHWTYSNRLVADLFPDSLSPPVRIEMSWRSTAELVCTAELLGRTYVVQREQSFWSDVPTTLWFFYRQDASGLYVADLVTSEPPACDIAIGRPARGISSERVRAEDPLASLTSRIPDPVQQQAWRAAWDRLEARRMRIASALGLLAGTHDAARARQGGPLPNEITQLRYPLHPGARWELRSDPDFVYVVEGHEMLDLPTGRIPAWRIRLVSSQMGPIDEAHIWFSRSGLAKVHQRFEGEATDGNPVGKMIVEYSQVLEDLTLARGRYAERQ